MFFIIQLELIEKTSLLLLLVYLITQLKWFYYLFNPLSSLYNKFYYNLIFVMLGLIGALLSVKIDGINLNNIHLGIMLAGLLGGISSAIFTSIIINVVLFLFDFNVPIVIIIQNILMAIFSGFYQKYYDVKKIETHKILIISSISIVMQVATNSIYSDFLKNILLQNIFLLSVNTTIGIYISLKIIKNAFQGYENLEALHAHETLKIADKTLPYLRTGLNPETAQKTVKLIMEIIDVEAVAITDKEKVLAFEGIGKDHHKTGAPVLTKATRDVLKKNAPFILNSKKDIGCPVLDCPLVSAVVAPLRCKNEIVGTLKFYQSKQKEIDPSKVSLSIGLANLLSMQMELAELGKLEQLTVQAELRALRAQINPHFLFNTLNTIASFSRTKPDEARQLLVKFADFFRKNLQQHANFITLKEEMAYLDDYLIFEKARFGERLEVYKQIDPNTLNINMPILTLQPIIENAIQHGISQKVEGGIIEIITKMQKNIVNIIIKDSGIGIAPQELKKVLTPGYGKGTGVGLSNINERLKVIYGKEYQVKIFSVYKKGTEVHIQIPSESLKEIVSFPKFDQVMK